MPLNLRIQKDLLADGDFRDKVQVAATAAALSIFPDAKANRSALALNVLQNPTGYVLPIAAAVVANIAPNVVNTSGQAVTDAIINAAVLAVWNDVAGETT
jgi:hypothetical protein